LAGLLTKKILFSVIAAIQNSNLSFLEAEKGINFGDENKNRFGKRLAE
jgi:hypothetical protein